LVPAISKGTTAPAARFTGSKAASRAGEDKLQQAKQKADAATERPSVHGTFGAR